MVTTINKVPYEDALEVCPRVDVVRREMLEPCSGAFREVEWQGLDDEEILIRPTCSIGKAEVFQQYSRVGTPKVLDDVRQHVETRWEQHLLDPLRERLQATSIRAQTV